MRPLEDLARIEMVSVGDFVLRSVVRDLIAHVQQQAEQIATLTARVATLESAGKVQTPAKLDEAPLGVGVRVLIPGEVIAVDETDGMRSVKFAAGGSDAFAMWFRPEHLRPEPAATTPPAAPASASDDYEHNQGGDDMRATGEKPDPVGRASGMAGTRPDDDPSFRAPAAGQAEASRKAAADDYEARARKFVRWWMLRAGEELVPDLAALLRTVADEARREERAACEAVCMEMWASKVKRNVPHAAALDCADRIAARGKGE